ncbi:MAG: SDR family NAD(P)-dependent oxidoreductase [Bdellovibrionota bacterium]
MNKLAVITGASSGIGLELARVFAEEGYDLIVNSGTERIFEAGEALRGLGVEVTEVQADLATREGVETLFDQMQTFGRKIDAVVLNAGVGVGGEFVSTSYEEELNLMNLNVINTVYLAKLVLKDFVQRNEGKMLITSSIAGEMPGPYYAVYAASKAFLQSFTEALHYEMKDTGRNVTVTALQPGATETEFFARANLLDTPGGEAEKADPAKVARDGFDALMAGKDSVVSGVKNKIQTAAGKLMSEQAGAANHAAQLRPNSIEGHGHH